MISLAELEYAKIIGRIGDARMTILHRFAESGYLIAEFVKLIGVESKFALHNTTSFADMQRCNACPMCD